MYLWNSVEVHDAAEKLQLELTELQYDSILCSSLNSLNQAASLPVSRFSESRFSTMNLYKSTFSTRIIDIYLHDAMQFGISEMEPNVNSLAEQSQAQASN
jgi:hypothetical protein